MSKARRLAPQSESPTTAVSTSGPQSEAPATGPTVDPASTETATPTLDAAAKSTKPKGGTGAAPSGTKTSSDSGGGGGGGGGDTGGVQKAGISAHSGDGSGTRVEKSTRKATLTKSPIASKATAVAAETSAPESAAPTSEGVGGGPIDYTERPSDAPPPPDSPTSGLSAMGATELARNVDQLGSMMEDHLDAVANGQSSGGVFSTGSDGDLGNIHTQSTVQIGTVKSLEGGGASGTVAEAREAEERDPEHYKGSATYDPAADTSDIDVEEGPATPPSRGDWSDLPSQGDPGYPDWMMRYQMWWNECVAFDGQGSGNSMDEGDLPHTNHPDFEMLWWDYRAWWDLNVDGGEPSADELAALNINVGGVSGTDEEMRFHTDTISVDEYLQQGADPDRVNQTVDAGVAEADAMLATANADADGARTGKFAEAELAGTTVEADFSTVLPEESTIASPERPGDMEEYLAMMEGGTIEGEVAAGFDERMAPGLDASWGALEETVDSEVGDFEGSREEAIFEGEVEAEAMTAAARDEQAAAVDQAHMDADGKRDEIKDRQEAAINDAKAQMDGARDEEFDKIDAERSRVQGEVDSELSAAEQKVDAEVDKGKADAEKIREEGEEKKKKKRKWWQKLWDFVKKVVKWIVDQVKKVFELVRTVVNTIVKAVVDVVTALIDAVRTLVVGLIQALAEVMTFIIQNTLGQIFPELAAELCAFIDTVADVLTEAVNKIADQLIETIETVAETVLSVINAVLSIAQFAIEMGLQVAMAAMSGEWGEFLLFLIESALAIAGISEEEFESYFGADPEVLQTVVDDPGGFMDRLGESFGMGFSQFGDNFGTHLKTGFFEWLTGAMGDAGIEMPDTWDFKGILKLVLSVLGVSAGGIRAKVKEFFGEKTAKIVDMLIDYGAAFKEDGLKGVIREISLDVTGTVREDVVDKAAEDVGGSGMGLLDSLLDLLDAFANGDGMEALLDFAKDDLGSILKDLVVDSIVDIVMNQVIKKGIELLVSMFNPVSALVQMLITAWNIFQSVKQVLGRIQAVVLSIVEGIIDVVLGNLADVANNIENALADLIPVAIELLAGVLGLGSLDDKIRDALEGIRARVDSMIDKFFELIREGVDGLVNMVRGWFDDNPQDEAAEGEGALMDPMGLDAGGGPVVYWVEAEDGSLRRVVQGDPESLAAAWGDGVGGQIEGLGASEGEEYGGGGWTPDGVGSLEGGGSVEASTVEPGDATFTPSAMSSDADTPAAYMADFATALPSVQSASWPSVGTDVDGLAGANVDAVQGGLVPIEATLPGEATGGTVDVDLPVTGAAPNVDVQGPTVDSIPLPDFNVPGGDNLSAVAEAMPEAPSLTGATDIGPGQLSSAADTGVGAAQSSAESLRERMETVAADDAIVPIAADHQASVDALSGMDIQETAPLDGMTLYASLALPQDVHAQFDSLMLAESADSIGPARDQLDGAETQRDVGIEGALTTVDADAKGLVSQAGLDQTSIMDEQRGRIAGARETALDEQGRQLASLEGDLDNERNTRMSDVTFRLESDQVRLDSAYSDAKSEAASALSDAEKSADDAEKEAEDPSWWDTLADYAQQAVDWLKDTIASIFEGLREAVTVIFDTVTEVAHSIIDEATAYITDALTSFGEFVQVAIQTFLGDVLPELADALCELVQDAVQLANETMEQIATDLKLAVDALALTLETSLNAALDTYESAVQGAIDLAEAALEGDWTEILVRIVEAVLQLAGIDPAEFWAMVGKAEDTLQTIIEDPGVFVSNAIDAMGQGFGQFGDNFLTHLETGFLDWLGSNIGDIDLPETFDLAGVLDITLQVLGLDADGLREKAEDRLGAETVEVIEQVWDYIDATIQGGLAGLWEEVQGDLADLWDMVVGGLQDWLLENVVMAAIGKLASMFTPVGALVQAVKTVWEVYEFLQDKASELMAVVSGWVDSIADIANGSLDGAADRIETALAGGLSLAIDLLANLMGLGGVGDKVQEIIDSVQTQVDEAIDSLLERLANTFRSTGDGDGDGETGTTNPNAVPVPMPETVHFEDEESDAHRLWFEDADHPILWVASEEGPVTENTGPGTEFPDVNENAVDALAIDAQNHMSKAKTAGAEGKADDVKTETALALSKKKAIRNALEISGADWDPAHHDYTQHPLWVEFKSRCDAIGYGEAGGLFETVLAGVGYGVIAGDKEKAGEDAEADLSRKMAQASFDTVANDLLEGCFDAPENEPHALWSGGSPAMSFASAAGYTPMEMTAGGSIFDNLQTTKGGQTFELGDWTFLQPMWHSLSRAFAQRVRLDLEIHVFQRWVGGVYRNVELEELRNRARDQGLQDALDMRYHALVLYQSDQTIAPFGAPSGVPMPSSTPIAAGTQVVCLSGASGSTTRSDWLSLVSGHEASAMSPIDFDETDLLAAVPLLDQGQAEGLINAIDPETRSIHFDAFIQNEIEIELCPATVQFFLQKMVAVIDSPSQYIEDVPTQNDNSELPLITWDPVDAPPLVEDGLHDIIFQATDKNSRVLWDDGRNRWEAHPNDTIADVVARTGAEPGLHPRLDNMTKAELIEVLAAIADSTNPLSAEQIDSYRDMAAETYADIQANEPLSASLEQALLGVINEHIMQHLEANPVLAVAWAQAKVEVRANPTHADAFDEDGELKEMSSEAAEKVYKATRDKMKSTYSGLIGQLEALHGPLGEAFQSLPKGIHFHHLLLKSVVPKEAITGRNLMLAKGDSGDDLHSLMHLMASGTNTANTKAFHEAIQALISRALKL